MENDKFVQLCEFETIVVNRKFLIWTYIFLSFPQFSYLLKCTNTNVLDEESTSVFR